MSQLSTSDDPAGIDIGQCLDEGSAPEEAQLFAGEKNEHDVEREILPRQDARGFHERRDPRRVVVGARRGPRSPVRFPAGGPGRDRVVMRRHEKNARHGPAAFDARDQILGGVRAVDRSEFPEHGAGGRVDGEGESLDGDARIAREARRKGIGHEAERRLPQRESSPRSAGRGIDRKEPDHRLERIAIHCRRSGGPGDLARRRGSRRRRHRSPAARIG